MKRPSKRNDLKARGNRRRRAISRFRRPRLETLAERIVFSLAIDDFFHESHKRFSPQEDFVVIPTETKDRSIGLLDNDFQWSGHYRIEQDPTSDLHGQRIDLDYDLSRPEVIDLISLTTPEHGSVELLANGYASYTAAEGFEGIDQFSYELEIDGEIITTDVYVNVIQPVLAVPDWFLVDEGSENNLLNVLENDRTIYAASSFQDAWTHGSVDTDFKIISVEADGVDGTIEIDASESQLIFNPDGDATGLQTFQYTIENNDGDRATATGQIQVSTLDGSDKQVAFPEQVQQYLLEAAIDRHHWQFAMPSSHGSYGYYDPWPIGIDIAFDGDFGLPVLRSTAIPEAATNSFALSITDDLVATQSFDDTNAQSGDVDEGDLIKTNGEYLFQVTNWSDTEGTLHHQLVISDIRDSDDPRVVSRYALDGTVKGLHLLGDRVAVISENAADANASDTQVTVLDVADPTSPGLVYQSDIDGEAQQTRVVGNQLFVIADVASNRRMPELEQVCFTEDAGCFYETGAQFIDRVSATIMDTASVDVITTDADGNSTQQTAPIYLSDEESNGWDDFLISSIVCLDIASDGDGASDLHSFIHSDNSEIYVSANSIYFLDNDYTGHDRSTRPWMPWGLDWETRINVDVEVEWVTPTAITKIEKIDFDSEGNLSWSASGTANGHVLNSFSVDEHDGFLRLATTGNFQSSVQIVGQSGTQLDTVGSIDGLAPGEQIYSVRFEGDRGFVVTFRQVDPLFVFDLSDPESPELLGELKIPGYSNYLQVIDENHLLGIGRDANEWGLYEEMQVSLFDISDLENPQLKNRYSFEGGRSLWSPLLEGPRNLGNHHTVNYFASHQTLVLPVYTSDHGGWTWGNEYEAEVSMRVLDIDTGSGISELGRVDFDGPFNPDLARAVRVGDVLYSVSPDLIKANKLRDPQQAISQWRVGAGAVSDTYVTRGSSEMKMDLLENDGIIDDPEMIIEVEQPEIGGTVAMEDNEINFIPDTGFVGEAEFVYSVETGGVRSQASVSVEVKRSWHNEEMPMDVDQDGKVSAKDALNIINTLLRVDSTGLDALDTIFEQSTEATDADRFMVDVTNDGEVTARDALILINHFTRENDTISAVRESEKVIDEALSGYSPEEESKLF